MPDLPPDPHPVTSLDPTSEPGLWLVTTASGSRHLIDTQDPDTAPRVQRLPRADTTPVDGEFLAATLRRDSEWMPLLGAGWLDSMTGERGDGLRVGADAVLWLDLRGDGIPTVWRTTPVVTIEQVSERAARVLVRSALPDPTRCYVTGCDRENEVMLHLRDDPWGGADLCMEHARLAAERVRSLIARCGCGFCERARVTLLGMDA
ncbi:hypothetical protein [Xylanimonas ulmi]|uniref:Uncharacterized protein n=1 Tax=Xylanimonas ulmi TaxID=228973 RepID=A0A4Q7M3G9_9MICO|nr:hypothetical protein [Xylanibacterium ulmi]RZS62466.1 hypothetical protein EV386_2799 [Xylanibacterium ulmi]